MAAWGANAYTFPATCRQIGLIVASEHIWQHRPFRWAVMAQRKPLCNDSGLRHAAYTQRILKYSPVLASRDEEGAGLSDYLASALRPRASS